MQRIKIGDSVVSLSVMSLKVIPVFILALLTPRMGEASDLLQQCQNALQHTESEIQLQISNQALRATAFNYIKYSYEGKTSRTAAIGEQLRELNEKDPDSVFFSRFSGKKRIRKLLKTLKRMNLKREGYPAQSLQTPVRAKFEMALLSAATFGALSTAGVLLLPNTNPSLAWSYLLSVVYLLQAAHLYPQAFHAPLVNQNIDQDLMSFDGTTSLGLPLEGPDGEIGLIFLYATFDGDPVVDFWLYKKDFPFSSLYKSDKQSEIRAIPDLTRSARRRANLKDSRYFTLTSVLYELVFTHLEAPDEAFEFLESLDPIDTEVSLMKRTMKSEVADLARKNFLQVNHHLRLSLKELFDEKLRPNLESPLGAAQFAEYAKFFVDEVLKDPSDTQAVLLFAHMVEWSQSRWLRLRKHESVKDLFRLGLLTPEFEKIVTRVQPTTRTFFDALDRPGPFIESFQSLPRELREFLKAAQY